MNKQFFRVNGLIAASYTALNPDGSLNLGAIEQQAAVLIDDGAAGVFVCGTTGEGPSLSAAERMQVATRWREVVAPGRLKVVVHVGHNSLVDAINLARHAAMIGADSISMVAPNYFRAATVDDLLEFCAPVANAAPNLPFYYYEIPAMTGVHVSMTEFLEKGARAMPNLAGLKFSSTDLAVLQECRAYADGRYDLLFGCDEMLLAALALGVRGAVGSTYNYATPLYKRIIEAFDRGEWDSARALQLKSVELVNILKPFGVLAAGKAVMSCRGIDCGPVRPPLRKLAEHHRSALLEKITKSDLVSDLVDGRTLATTRPGRRELR